MGGHNKDTSGGHRARYREENAKWAMLCERFLSVAPENSIWRYSREMSPDDPEQGWKLHVSATVLTATRVIEAVAPILHSRRVLYKAPATLGELEKLNNGLHYGYSQVGKFLTIYPRTTEEAVRLARILHWLTRRLSAPPIPFDSKYRPDSCVYYRYGAFRALELESLGGSRALAVRDPAGNLVPDLRESAPKPEWISDPFLPKSAPHMRAAAPTPLQTRFKAFRAMAQRGKGGVYIAFDISATPPRLCVLKEGRLQGEVILDGRDGSWRVRHEERVLQSLATAGIAVPYIYSSFEAEKNYYLATEFIEGESLEKWLSRKRRRLPLVSCISLGVELALLIADIHDAGWVWRDCKPANIILTRRGALRPLDFEGACPVHSPDPMPWGTPSHVPPEWDAKFAGQSRLPEDLYALGTVIHLLIAGCLPDASPRLPLEKLRRDVPHEALSVVTELLDRNPRCRPHARAVGCRLKAALDAGWPSHRKSSRP